MEIDLGRELSGEVPQTPQLPLARFSLSGDVCERRFMQPRVSHKRTPSPPLHTSGDQGHFTSLSSSLSIRGHTQRFQLGDRTSDSEGVSTQV